MPFLSKIFLILLIHLFLLKSALATVSNVEFKVWVESYKKKAFESGVSLQTLDLAFKNVKFLEKVIFYDRKQPEFFEDTITYVSKRATSSKAKKARDLLKKNKNLFNEVENKFKVEKEILLALWGIETHFGKHVGKMDIISSLATLSYDKRRSEFFSLQFKDPLMKTRT